MVTDTDSRWLPAPKHLTLPQDEMHIWCASLGATELCIHSLRSVLAQDEVVRAERYRRAEDRDRCIVARGLLRFILGRYLDMPPEGLRFRYGSHGKPSLIVEPRGKGLQFNVSRSGGLVLYAMAWDRQIGVDLEQIEPISGVGQLVERYFSSSERAAFRALPKEKQMEAFYRCWTRKEAFVKARGQGLALDLDQFTVSVAPSQARLLNVVGDPAEASRWSYYEFSPVHDYVATVAAEVHGCRLACRQWMHLDVVTDYHIQAHRLLCEVIDIGK